MVLRDTNKTAWGTMLLLMSVLVSLVDCISLGHTLKAQHCFLSLNGCLAWHVTDYFIKMFSKVIVLSEYFDIFQ